MSLSCTEPHLWAVEGLRDPALGPQSPVHRPHGCTLQEGDGAQSVMTRVGGAMAQGPVLHALFGGCDPKSKSAPWRKGHAPHGLEEETSPECFAYFSNSKPLY